MRQIILLKMGREMSISLYMVEKTTEGSAVIMCKNAMAGHVSYLSNRILNKKPDYLLHLNQNNPQIVIQIMNKTPS